MKARSDCIALHVGHRGHSKGKGKGHVAHSQGYRTGIDENSPTHSPTNIPNPWIMKDDGPTSRAWEVEKPVSSSSQLLSVPIAISTRISCGGGAMHRL